MNLIFLSAVSGVGKSATCDYIKDNNLLDDYVIFDIDDLENINDYNEDTYNFFYLNAVKKAVDKSHNKNIIIGSCINPNDVKNIVVDGVDSIDMILITCSNEELEKRLKSRDESRNCGSLDYIKGQIEYQKYLLNHLDLYKLHIDNTNSSIDDVSKKIVSYIRNNWSGSDEEK